MRRIVLLPVTGRDDVGPAQESEPLAPAEAAPPVAEERPPAAEETEPAEDAPPAEPPGAAQLADLRAWLRLRLGEELGASGVLLPLLAEPEEGEEPEPEVAPLPTADELLALAAGASVELCCALRLDAAEGGLALELLVAEAAAGAGGGLRLRLCMPVALERAARLPRLLARELLLAVGDEAALPAEGPQEPVAPEALFLVCRAVRLLRGDLAGKDPAPALADLLDALALEPDLAEARDPLIEAARAGADGPFLPSFLSALEQLAQLTPGDPRALLQLADYRALHLDAPAAQRLLHEARRISKELGDPDAEVQALSRLAAVAERTARHEEACLHLRSALRLCDDAGLYLRLGVQQRALRLPEALPTLQRAAALDPASGPAQLALADALADAGEPLLAASALARVVELEGPESPLSEEARARLASLLG